MVAYTSLGLVISSHTVVRKKRILPIKGEVRVTKGTQVYPETQVAYTEVPGYPVPINVAAKLGVEPSEISKFMVKKAGDVLKAGEVFAHKKAFLPLPFLEEIEHAPIDGTLESVSEYT